MAVLLTSNVLFESCLQGHLQGYLSLRGQCISATRRLPAPEGLDAKQVFFIRKFNWNELGE